MLRTYYGFIALTNATENFPAAGRIFTKPKVDRNTVLDAEYVVVPSRDVDAYVEETGGRIPSLLAGKGLTEWLEAPMLREIILDRLERDVNAPVTDILEAIFHYIEHDTFKDC